MPIQANLKGRDILLLILARDAVQELLGQCFSVKLTLAMLEEQIRDILGDNCVHSLILNAQVLQDLRRLIPSIREQDNVVLVGLKQRESVLQEGGYPKYIVAIYSVVTSNSLNSLSFI